MLAQSIDDARCDPLHECSTVSRCQGNDVKGSMRTRLKRKSTTILGAPEMRSLSHMCLIAFLLRKVLSVPSLTSSL